MLEGVYRIHNKTKNVSYVGSTLTTIARINIHFSSLDRNAHQCPKLQADYNAGDEIASEVLYTTNQPLDLNDLLVRLAVAEQMFIDSYLDVYNKIEAPIQAALINKYLKVGLINSEWEADLANHISTVKAETGIKRIREGRVEEPEKIL